MRLILYARKLLVTYGSLSPLKNCPLDKKVKSTGNSGRKLLRSLSDVLVGVNVSLPTKKSDFLSQWLVAARKLGPGVSKPTEVCDNTTCVACQHVCDCPTPSSSSLVLSPHP